MRKGKMNQRIAVWRQGAETRNALNEPIRPWAEYGKFWAGEMKARATEAWKAGQTAAQVERAFRVRYTARTATITASDRLKVEGQDLEIIGVTEVGRRDEIEIVAIASNAKGLKT